MSSTELRVGTDIQAVGEVAHSIRTFGGEYLHRVFTEHEIEASGGSTAASAPGLAARFAAKESVLKVLRPNDDAIPWTSIEIIRTPGGWTEVLLHNQAAALAQANGLGGFAVSLSHDAGLATASVVAHRSTEQDTACMS